MLRRGRTRHQKQLHGRTTIQGMGDEDLFQKNDVGEGFFDDKIAKKMTS